MIEEFSAATRAWFAEAFQRPTAAQAQAWRAISRGEHTLVVAPTGSGKTLAAFLWSLDRLASAPPPPDPKHRCRVLYVSPLKALAVDVERNLRTPLAGIRAAARRLGLPLPEIRVGVRSGDTPSGERRRLAARPPDILITTPESLFLLLTSQARESLRGVETVIVDEIHAVAATKRGAHLALSLERLDDLLASPAQRVGLSATVRPLPEVAALLGGSSPVTTVRPPDAKVFDLSVTVPAEDLPDAPGSRRRSVWPHVEEHILSLIDAHRSTLVFANSRRLAERLCTRLNELAAARLPDPLQARAAGGGAVEVARAHHGSVSKEERAQIESALKEGRLPAVVATSSLELGIDMGAVDLVVQVESPPSVAGGLQRVGRAGHQVGAVSRGVIFPRYRGDLVQAAVVAERMRAGLIEALRYPRNPLDVLAQQIVAMVAMDEWDVDGLERLVRRAAPFAELPRSVYEATLDMLAGRYPGEEFGELRPRLVWDRANGTLRARRGAQRLAVVSGGTIPDRGLFGVFLAGEHASRVGELDEEMVYESRVGDVFVLGASSWRVEEITSDRVLVSPASGGSGRLPFWHGDSPGRPAELGRAIGAFTRELGGLDEARARERASAAGLDPGAIADLLSYLAEQKESTGHVPDDRTLVVERFRDELGDWRLVVHSPYGALVHAPWALAIAARLRALYGVDAQAMHADDGIVLRVPDTDGLPPSVELCAFDPDGIERLVIDELGSSALFAARFRECASRSLLLPRHRPGHRMPLWQQRRRASQLLSVAVRHPGFPVVLETVRECLQDVFDVPGLVSLMRDVSTGTVRVTEVETPSASPYARSLLFRYIAAFMYEGDSPLAERRAQALTLDSSLLSDLLGHSDLRELLDPEVLAEAAAELQRLTPSRRATDPDTLTDLLRALGPLSLPELEARAFPPSPAGAWLASLEGERRVIRVRVAGTDRWAAVEDAARLRDALGVPLPKDVPEPFLASLGDDPLGDLLTRYARTHGPFTTADAAARLGLGTAVVHEVLARLPGVLEGEFTPGRTGSEWVDAEVLRLLRRRSLARLRAEVEPSPPEALARFLPRWQGVGSSRAGSLHEAVELLQGAPLPASALETLILPSRVPGYTPALLDELTTSGEVLWLGRGPLPGGDGWLSLYPADTAPLLLPPPAELPLAPLHQAVLDALADGSALFFRPLADRVRSSPAVASQSPSPFHPGDQEILQALWELVWAGRLTNDTLAPLRAALGTARPAPRPRPLRRGRPVLGVRAAPPSAAGRWWLPPAPYPDPTHRAHALTEVLLHRHGVLLRGSVSAEQSPGGFAALYPVLRAQEEAGHCRRGYFIDGLGAAQFALPHAVDLLRSLRPSWTGTGGGRPPIGNPGPSPTPGSGTAERPSGSGSGGNGFSDLQPNAPGEDREPPESPPGVRPEAPGAEAVVLAAADPANPYGAALAWPEGSGGHRPGRKAGALVVLVDGVLTMYAERGGRTLLTWNEPGRRAAVRALALAVREGMLSQVTVERADGEPITGSPLARVFEEAGFHPTPRGVRLRR
ncbi:ATP-dependent helicase [Actinocorallia sp. B10E7]|uniref:ATP-dependent helicase n=1 Tax=Actinocorallia sp. B10E7 TaxID=3153558 RepID=UPI00325F2734